MNIKDLPQYSSLDEKSTFFAPPEDGYPWIVNTEDEFDSLYNRLCSEYNKCIEANEPYLLFRGICEAKYKTFTSAQRSWLTHEWKNPTQEGFVGYITLLLDLVKQNHDLVNFYKSLSIVPTDLLYLAFLQHFGAPSPMLDFTHSLDMGLFFMQDGASEVDYNSSAIEQYFSLQLIDLRAYKFHIAQLSEILSDGLARGKNMVEATQSLYPNAIIDQSLIEDIRKLTAWNNPNNPGGDIRAFHIVILDYANKAIVKDLKGNMLKWTNLRIIAQRGALLLYTDSMKPLEEYFLIDMGAPAIRCFNIHKSLKKYILGKIPFDRTKVYPSEEEIVKEVNRRALSLLSIL